jgi:hypothetical protein
LVASLFQLSDIQRKCINRWEFIPIPRTISIVAADEWSEGTWEEQAKLLRELNAEVHVDAYRALPGKSAGILMGLQGSTEDKLAAVAEVEAA